MPLELHELESQDVASLGPAAFEYQAAVLRLHAAQKSVGLGPAPIVGLECTFHRSPHRPVPEGWANLRGYQ